MRTLLQLLMVISLWTNWSHCMFHCENRDGSDCLEEELSRMGPAMEECMTDEGCQGTDKCHLPPHGSFSKGVCATPTECTSDDQCPQVGNLVSGEIQLTCRIPVGEVVGQCQFEGGPMAIAWSMVPSQSIYIPSLSFYTTHCHSIQHISTKLSGSKTQALHSAAILAKNNPILPKKN